VTLVSSTVIRASDGDGCGGVVSVGVVVGTVSVGVVVGTVAVGVVVGAVSVGVVVGTVGVVVGCAVGHPSPRSQHWPLIIAYRGLAHGVSSPARH